MGLRVLAGLEVVLLAILDAAREAAHAFDTIGADVRGNLHEGGGLRILHLNLDLAGPVVSEDDVQDDLLSHSGVLLTCGCKGDTPLHKKNQAITRCLTRLTIVSTKFVCLAGHIYRVLTLYI